MHLVGSVIRLSAAALVLGVAHAHAARAPHLPSLLVGRDLLEDEAFHRRQVLADRTRRQEPGEGVHARTGGSVASQSHQSRRRSGPLRTRDLEERQSVGRCGPNFADAVCDPGYCCSSAGWCGQGYLYCSAPSCQINYGPACDANRRPNGPDTSTVARPKVGSVPYGSAIYRCNVNGHIALTYDDGPYLYTSDLLDLLKRYNARATFFVTGNNLGKGMINDETTPWPAIIRRMIADGHQIASHTWAHQRMTLLTLDQVRQQMIFNEIALNNLLGYFPTYMRPPYSASNADIDAVLGSLGYHVTYFNLDTEGYLHDAPELIQDSKDIWDDTVEGASPTTNKWLHIEHDPVFQAVYNLTEYMLQSLARNGFTAVTVGECLGDPPANWYRTGPTGPGPSSSVSVPSSSSRTSTSPTSSPTVGPPTTNGRCGINYSGMTCVNEGADRCCSPAGWCGGSTDHCGIGCQPLYGQCGAASSSSSSRPASSSSSSQSVSSPSSSSTSVPPLSSPSSSTRASSTSSSPSSTPTVGPPTTNGRCGVNFGGMTCFNQPTEPCCSPAGWCGASAAHCGTGCQSPFGQCSGTGGQGSSSSSRSSSSTTSPSSSTRPSSTSSSSTSTPTVGPPSTNGRCGVNFGGTTCFGEPTYPCCSSAGWCGASAAHCGTGCQAPFGTCT